MISKYINLKSNRIDGFIKIFGSGFLTKILSFCSSIILARIVAKEVYGIYSYVSNIYSIIILTSGFGAITAILQLSSEHFGDSEIKNSIYSFGLKYGMLFNVFLVFVVLTVGITFNFKIVGSKQLFLFYSLLPIFDYLFQFEVIYYRCERNENAYFFVNVIYQLTNIISSVVGVIILKEKGFIIAQYLSLIASSLSGYIKYNFNISLKLKLSISLIKDFVRLSFVSVLGNTFFQIKLYLASFFLSIYVPNVNVLADFNVASKLPNALMFLPSTLAIYIYPYFAEKKNDMEWTKNKFKILMLINGSVNFVIMLISCLFSKQIIYIVFGSAYIDCVQIFNMLMINYFVISTFVNIPGNLLSTQRKEIFNLIVNVVVGISSIFINIYLIRLFGAIGAAYSEIVVSLLYAVVYMIYLVSIYTKLSLVK